MVLPIRRWGISPRPTASYTSSTVTSLIRHIVKWHRGASPGRHPDFPKVKLGRPTKTKVTKSILLDEDDINHLDKLSAPFGTSRVTALIMVITQWFDLPAFQRD